MITQKSKKIHKALRIILPSALISVLLYIMLHEFGHAIVLWAVGADITEFSILSAHVSYDGGAWTDTSDRWMHLNGAFFPIVISVAYMLLYRKDVSNRFYHLFSGFFVLMPIASLLAWVFIPVLYTFGQAPEDDDVYKFLYNFCFDNPAFVVTICAIVLMGGCIYLAVKKGIVRNFRATISQIKNSNERQI